MKTFEKLGLLMVLLAIYGRIIAPSDGSEMFAMIMVQIGAVIYLFGDQLRE